MKSTCWTPSNIITVCSLKTNKFRMKQTNAHTCVHTHSLFHLQWFLCMWETFVSVIYVSKDDLKCVSFYGYDFKIQRPHNCISIPHILQRRKGYVNHWHYKPLFEYIYYRSSEKGRDVSEWGTASPLGLADTTPGADAGKKSKQTRNEERFSFPPIFYSSCCLTVHPLGYLEVKEVHTKGLLK